MAAPNWDEQKHPREPKGSAAGGQFAHLSGSGLGFSAPNWKFSPKWEAEITDKGGNAPSWKGGTPKLSWGNATSAQIVELNGRMASVGWTMTSSLKYIPPDVVKQFKIKKAPVDRKLAHLQQAAGFLLVSDLVKNTVLKNVVDPANARNIQIIFADIGSPDTGMLTGAGLGKGIWVVNTSFDALASVNTIADTEDEFEAKGQQIDVAEAAKSLNIAEQYTLQEYILNHNRETAAYMMLNQIALHEIVHMANLASGKQLVMSFEMAMAAQLAKEGKTVDWPTAEKWMHENISGYAVSSGEAMAEAACKYILEGKLPGEFLQAWGEIMISQVEPTTPSAKEGDQTTNKAAKGDKG